MLQLARAIVWVASDVLRLVVSFLRSSSAIRAENLVLRRQLARYIELGIRLWSAKTHQAYRLLELRDSVT